MTGVGITDKKKRNTDNLCRELMEEPDIDTYIKKNQPFFADSSISDLLTEFYKRQKISKAELSRRAGMSEVYLHQLFSGRRKPSRDKLLCLCGADDRGNPEAFKAGGLRSALSED